MSEVALVTEPAEFQLFVFDQSGLLPAPTQVYGSAAAAGPANTPSTTTAANSAAAVRPG